MQFSLNLEEHVQVMTENVIFIKKHVKKNLFAVGTLDLKNNLFFNGRASSPRNLSRLLQKYVGLSHIRTKEINVLNFLVNCFLKISI